MPIETVTVNKVTCQQCDNFIFVKQWQDARKFGWCVPSDGHLHLCPSCLEIYKDEAIASAVPG